MAKGQLLIHTDPDPEAGVVHAYLMDPSGSGDKVELSSVNLALCENMPAAFDLWKEFLRKLGEKHIADCGARTVGYAEFGEGDLN